VINVKESSCGPFKGVPAFARVVDVSWDSKHVSSNYKTEVQTISLNISVAIKVSFNFVHETSLYSSNSNVSQLFIYAFFAHNA
jgi:hypothetical protein